MQNEEIIDNFNKTIRKEEKYKLSWPWKLSKYELLSNSLVEGRLKSLVNNFRNEELKKEYDDIINKQLLDGTIEKADSTKEYLHQDGVIVHYIRHHDVANENNAQKRVRIVHEGCAKPNNTATSLNECLQHGPNLIANLGGVLLRFRMNLIAITADIKSAYLQMQLNPYDRDVIRFLWVKYMSKNVTSDNLQEFRLCKVIWGIISSAFLLAYTISYHLKRYKHRYPTIN